jgi:hypothetical protein
MIDPAKFYTYACDDVRFVRKDRPDVWITADQVNGKMFRSYPLFEFVPGERGAQEPKRYGDFVIDIDTGERAVKDAIQIVDHFAAIYGIEADQWRVYLSGKKGVHLELPAEILGTEDGAILLPLAYKRLAKDIEGDLNVKLDTSMYNVGTGKPYRQPNIMRDTGTCKRQIDYSDLYEINTEEEYQISCNAPGPTWQPENVGRNQYLATKIAAYLDEAARQQEVIRNAPKLSGDDLDRLTIAMPACVSVLANLTDTGRTSATFNDVAIQLTAYAVTTQRTEQEFLDGCHPFIANYPSTSLNTPAKRLENCRARFRTMAANGNQFSCGGVLSLGFSGFKCDECKVKPAGPQVTVETMSIDDLAQLSATLFIPDEVLNPGGLISLGVKALSQPGLPDIPQYNLPVVLTTIANAIAGKLAYGKVWPNVFNLKIGPTSTGKSDSDTAMVEAINAANIPNFYGPTDFSSGPALMRALAEMPKALIVIDEATALFKRYDRPDPVSDGKRDALLEVFSASGKKIKKAYADSKKTIDIDAPCVSLTGNATPVIYDSIKQEDFHTGIMQRFDFWCYDGPAPMRGIAEEENEHLAAFAAGIADLKNTVPPGGGNMQFLGVPHKLAATTKAKEILRDWSAQVVNGANAAQTEGEKGIIGRKYHLAIKYALIHVAATRPVSAIFEPLSEVDIEYGKAVANMLSSWKINTAFKRVSMGEFHHQCEMFKQAIASAMKMGKRPTFKVLANRRPELKNWKRKDSEEVISVLVKRGEVAKDDTKPNTSYLLVKDAS